MNRLPLDPARLSPASRTFAAQLFARHEWLRTFAWMAPREASDLCDLTVEAVSPTGDASRSLTIWMEHDEPSLGWSDEWHTHATLWGGDDSYLPFHDLIDAILADRFVLAADIGGTSEGERRALDRRTPDALTEELTSRWSPGRVRLFSWTGSANRVVGLEDLD